MSSKRIVLPLYEHATEEGARELAAAIEECFGLSQSPIVEGFPAEDPRPGYCRCETPVFDPEHDAGCRRCGLPIDFSPRTWNDVDGNVRVD